jgi:hypothetical protein
MDYDYLDELLLLRFMWLLSDSFIYFNIRSGECVVGWGGSTESNDVCRRWVGRKQQR